MCELIINSNFATAEPKQCELQKYPQIRFFFKKKECFTQDSNLGPQKLLSTDLPLDQADTT